MSIIALIVVLAIGGIILLLIIRNKNRKNVNLANKISQEKKEQCRADYNDIKDHSKFSPFDYGVFASSSYDGQIKIYDLERTIIDILRDRNKIDTQIFNQALNGYIKRKDKNLVKLSKYAKAFKIENVFRGSYDFCMKYLTHKLEIGSK